MREIYPPEGERSFFRLLDCVYECRVVNGERQVKADGEWMEAEAFVEILPIEAKFDLAMYGMKFMSQDDINELLKEI